jgi:heterodisulfide reductase subunit A
VDEEKCTGCGACREKCPTRVSDAFNEGLTERTAIYQVFAQGIPSTMTIDPLHCRQLTGKKCGLCRKACPAEAIDFDQQDRLSELSVGAVVLAVGYDVFNPSRIPEYQYGVVPNVVTAMEFERLLSASGPTGGHLDRPSDRAAQEKMKALEQKLKRIRKSLEQFETRFGFASPDLAEHITAVEEKDRSACEQWAGQVESASKLKDELEGLQRKAEAFTTAKQLAFIQCVGSRDRRFYPFCSGYCCLHSIKEAIIAHEHEPATQSTIFGMDIRAVGKGFEEYKIRGGNQSGITYIRCRVAEILDGPEHRPVVVYEDTREQKVVRRAFDLVILATACAPAGGNRDLAEILGVELDDFGFFKSGPADPLDTTRPGLFVCGCAQGPKDIPESVVQASAAAARAVQLLTELDRPRTGEQSRAA